jgi:hypothetical protein
LNHFWTLRNHIAIRLDQDHPLRSFLGVLLERAGEREEEDAEEEEKEEEKEEASGEPQGMSAHL